MERSKIPPDVEKRLRARLREAVRVDGRSARMIAAPAIKMFLDISPASRRSIYSIQESATETEKAFLARLLGRQILRGHHAIIERRYGDANREALQGSGSNAMPMTEEDLENEAARLCKMA
jgi:hypothetical protein